MVSGLKIIVNSIQKPASNLAIAMYGNGCGSAIGMFPSGMAAFLPYHSKSKFSGCFLQVFSFGRHE